MNYSSEYEHKKYEPFSIPARPQTPDASTAQEPPHGRKNANPAPTNAFVQIEIGETINTRPQPAAIAPVRPKPQAIKPLSDPIEEKFLAMRRIARTETFVRMDPTQLLYKRDQRMEAARLFYQQALFMQDFEDDYEVRVPFSSYYPYYQTMNREQLRTYFTWRARVRNGNVTYNSISYAFLYVYELINQVGVSDPADGLARLLAFWKAYRAYGETLDKYVVKWLRDYHVYYELPEPFGAFVQANGLAAHYQEAYGVNESADQNTFGLYAAMAKYDIRTSSFYTPERRGLIEACFAFTMDRLREAFAAASMDLDDLIIKPDVKKFAWYPFDGALFFMRPQQPDRQAVLTEKEIYRRRRDQWTRRACTDCNRHLTGYIIKEMESALRTAANYPRKLTANPDMLDNATARLLQSGGIRLETCIRDAVAAFYYEHTKTVVSVDFAALEKIRRESLDIQEKLIVPEYVEPPLHDIEVIPVTPTVAVAPADDPWVALVNTLTDTERAALRVILSTGNFKRFADENGVMAEVLIDGINQKAVDTVGDSVLEYADTQAEVYEEYRKRLTEGL